jgi:transposase
MNSTQLFEMALGLQSPWFIKEVEFRNENSLKELHINMGYDNKIKFKDNQGIECKTYDTKNRTWQHLNFFEHKCFLHCSVPRIKSGDGKVTMVDVPWSRKGSGFTLLFEALSLRLIESEMPVNKVASLLKVHPSSIWSIFNYWVKKSYSDNNIEEITQLGIDETSSKKGHNYLTVGVDLLSRKVIHVTEGKDAKTIEKIKSYMLSKSVKPEQITDASIDLSPSFISGLKKHFPTTEIHFDRFHVKKLLNKAMDEVRKSERKEHAELKGHKYTFLKSANKLSNQKQQSLSELITLFPTLGEAYRLKELFDDVWDMKSEKEASEFIDAWVKEVEEKNIPAFVKFSRTVITHKKGIVNFVNGRINNGILEGINSKIQLAKRRARGFRNVDNFINMIYFLCGKLKFRLPLDYA